MTVVNPTSPARVDRDVSLAARNRSCTVIAAAAAFAAGGIAPPG